MIDLVENPLLVQTSWYADNVSVSTIQESDNQIVLTIDGKTIDFDEKQSCHKMILDKNTNTYTVAEGGALFEIDFLEEFKKILENKLSIKIDKVVLNQDK